MELLGPAQCPLDRAAVPSWQGPRLVEDKLLAHRRLSDECINILVTLNDIVAVLITAANACRVFTMSAVSQCHNLYEEAFP